MRAWRFHEFGDIKNLVLEDAPEPELADGEVLVKVAYAALNPADHYLVLGQYPRPGTPPYSPGRDASGVVVRANGECAFKEGERVVLLGGLSGISRSGSLAEYMAVPQEWLAPLPRDWSLQEGAAAPLVFETAWQALVDRGEVKAGNTVLITGASGGVGSAALLLAKGLGVKVAAMSRSEEKRKVLKAFGADYIVDNGNPDWAKDLKKQLAGTAIDLVVENLGGDYLEASLKIVKPEGRVMVVGLLDGLEAKVTVGLLIHKCICIQGLSVSSYTLETAKKAWRGITETLHGTGAKPLVDKVFKMEEAQEAFVWLGRGPMGKVLLEFAGENV